MNEDLLVELRNASISGVGAKTLVLDAADEIDRLIGVIRSLESSIQEMLNSIGDVDGTMEAWLIGQKALRPMPQEV